MNPFAARSAWWALISFFLLVTVILGKTGMTGWINRLFHDFPDCFTARGLEDAMASSGRALQLELRRRRFLWREVWKRLRNRC